MKKAMIVCEDGIFYAPYEFQQALVEEIESRGVLTVTQAAALCEKWAKKP